LRGRSKTAKFTLMFSFEGELSEMLAAKAIVRKNEVNNARSGTASTPVMFTFYLTLNLSVHNIRANVLIPGLHECGIRRSRRCNRRGG
jgi:hypothetical protein